jgi:hypothetical protein
MKLFTAAAVAILMSSGMAFAQDANTTTNSTTRVDTDPGNYLAGPKIQEFYTDESRTNVRPPAEFKKVWEKMNDADRADVKQACSANRDVSYNPLCTNVGSM